MPIYRGDRKIASVYRGDRKIAKIYRGDRVVYSAKKRILLFVDGATPIYKAIYVKRNSGLFSATFTATPNFAPTLRKYEFTYKGDIGIGFYRQTLSKTKIARNGINLGGGNNSYNFPTSQKHNVIIDKDKLYVDDVLISTLFIGNDLDDKQEQHIALTPSSKFYEMKIYDNDVLTYHFVPAYQIIGNRLVYGIAELVNEEFVNDGDLIGEPEYE